MSGQVKSKISGLEASLLRESKKTDGFSLPTIGKIKDVPDTGIFLVEWGGDEEAKARVSVSLEDYPPESLIGREVLLLFEDNDPGKPIVIALLQPTSNVGQSLTKASKIKSTPEVFLDGDKVVIKANKKIELRVGKASIVIDENGKITTRGEHLLNRATGPIRIKGGHVDIN